MFGQFFSVRFLFVPFFVPTVLYFCVQEKKCFYYSWWQKPARLTSLPLLELSVPYSRCSLWGWGFGDTIKRGEAAKKARDRERGYIDI